MRRDARAAPGAGRRRGARARRAQPPRGAGRASEQAAQGEQAALGRRSGWRRPRWPPRSSAREAADARLRAADREHDEAVEAERRAAWLIERRRSAPDEGEQRCAGPSSSGELRRRAPRGGAHRARAPRARAPRVAGCSVAQAREDAELSPSRCDVQTCSRRCARRSSRCSAASRRRCAPTAPRARSWRGALRDCAQRGERAAGAAARAAEAVTVAEVAAQQARDQAGEAEASSGALAGRLGLEAERRRGAAWRRASATALRERVWSVWRAAASSSGR